MGLAVARGLALALDVPVAGVSTLHAFAGGQAVIDARRGEVFTEGPVVMRPEDLAVAGVRLIGDGAIRYRDLFESAGAEIPADDDPVHLPAAERLVAHATSFGAADAIEPLYLRAPDARPAS
jgi:tRNA threonylcarbamoyladenosine biosynthesis protein TsaB